jgi:hypothetical protein
MASRGPLLRPLPLRIGLAACALVLVAWGGVWWTGRSDGRLRLIFPALGGDGILIKGARGEIGVIDGGTDGTAFASWLGRNLPLGRRHIDLLLLTRADGTTLPGQLATVRRYAIGRALLVQPAGATTQWTELVQVLEAQGTPVHLATAGDQVLLGAAADPLHMRFVVLAAADGRLLIELQAVGRSILLLHSAGTTMLPAPAGAEPVAALVIPWNRRMDDPGLQGLRPDAIVFGEQPGTAQIKTLAERRIGTARLLHEDLDGEIELQIDRSGTRIATRSP